MHQCGHTHPRCVRVVIMGTRCILTCVVWAVPVLLQWSSRDCHMKCEAGARSCVQHQQAPERSPCANSAFGIILHVQICLWPASARLPCSPTLLALEDDLLGPGADPDVSLGSSQYAGRRYDEEDDLLACSADIAVPLGASQHTDRRDEEDDLLACSTDPAVPLGSSQQADRRDDEDDLLATADGAPAARPATWARAEAAGPEEGDEDDLLGPSSSPAAQEAPQEDDDDNLL
ncbi:unnamed protein product [Prorocentrum cordatum]|uniref:Uncharacterized protein n=1 Tax=Prorocentrum cordatum TaxID=2364126 RepID=A0ABN9UGN1_9DINO|nr:unnamed protein product [Polarella glacialis]